MLENRREIMIFQSSSCFKKIENAKLSKTPSSPEVEQKPRWYIINNCNLEFNYGLAPRSSNQYPLNL